MKKLLVILTLIVCQFTYSQITTYDENYKPFGEYTLSEDTYPVYESSSNNTTYTITPIKKAGSSSSGSATSDDGTVTVTYTYEWVGFFTYKVTVYVNGVAVETKTIYGSKWFGEDALKQEIYEYAKSVANEEAEERKMALPVGNAFILLAFCGLYVIRINIKIKD